MLAQVIRETGFKKAEDFYVALGAGKLQPGEIVNKVIRLRRVSRHAELGLGAVGEHPLLARLEVTA